MISCVAGKRTNGGAIVFRVIWPALMLACWPRSPTAQCGRARSAKVYFSSRAETRDQQPPPRGFRTIPSSPCGGTRRPGWGGSVHRRFFPVPGGKLATINASTGLSDNFVESMLVDREGNLWVGTGAGLNRVRRSNLAVYGQNEGLGYGPVQGLAEIAPGIIWACKPSDGLYRSEGRQFSRLTNGAASRRYPEVNTLLVTRDGSCWVAGAKGLLRFKDPKAAAPEEDAPALQERNVTALAEDSEGAVWAGTREG